MTGGALVKKISILLLVLLLLLCYGCACGHRTRFDLLHDESKICSIEIVGIVEEYDEETKQPSLITFAKIDDIDSFLKDFRKVKCRSRGVIGFSPDGVYQNEVAIKFSYENNDYELVSDGGRSIYTGGDLDFYRGHESFNDEQFDALIAKYYPSYTLHK